MQIILFKLQNVNVFFLVIKKHLLLYFLNNTILSPRVLLILFVILAFLVAYLKNFIAINTNYFEKNFIIINFRLYICITSVIYI